MECESQRTMSNASANMDNTEMSALIANRAGNQQKMRKNYNLFHDFCNMKGHTKETCYKIVEYPNDHKFKKKYNTQDVWIIDSGASNHMTSKIELLNNLSPLSSSSSVHLPNGDLAKITHSGSANIFKDYKISDVLHVPNFKYSPLSVSKITKELQCRVGFFPDLCVFQDFYTGKVLGISSEANGLYILRSCLHKIQSFTPTVNTTSMQTSTQNKQSSINLGVWNQRLGHLPMEAIKRIDKIKQHFKKDCSQVTWLDCHVCPLARQTKLSFPVSTSRAHAPFHLLHADTKQFIVSRDVVLKEHVFPFKQMKLPYVPVFPALEPTDLPNTTGALYQDQVDEHDATHDTDAVQGSDAVSELQHDSSHLQVVDDVLPIAVRKPPRSTGPPKWMHDFVSTSCVYPMPNYLSYDSMSPSYAKYLSAQFSIVEPKHYHEASKDARWITAMQQEVTTLEENNTWDVVDLPAIKVPIWCTEANKEVERFKARLVAKGFSQKEGLDYKETFSLWPRWSLLDQS
ncbi:uncharacterized protein LOC142163392 [Nicotiana tabacum]|uniref:Uncharacterized protein LOC142163392 n=1 Tax=Nicotiana tabacum TaxID=4097 RepID=A0AC58RVL3_TOBAC